MMMVGMTLIRSGAAQRTPANEQLLIGWTFQNRF
jgi:hypothetical protein